MATMASVARIAGSWPRVFRRVLQIVDVIELIGDVADRLLGVDGDVPQFGDAAVGLAP
jgi:hypothetical protein